MPFGFFIFLIEKNVAHGLSSFFLAITKFFVRVTKPPPGSTVSASSSCAICHRAPNTERVVPGTLGVSATVWQAPNTELVVPRISGLARRCGNAERQAWRSKHDIEIESASARGNTVGRTNARACTRETGAAGHPRVSTAGAYVCVHVHVHAVYLGTLAAHSRLCYSLQRGMGCACAVPAAEL